MLADPHSVLCLGNSEQLDRPELGPALGPDPLEPEQDRVYLNLNGSTIGVSFETRWEGGLALPITRAHMPNFVLSVWALTWAAVDCLR